jgi:hypothetical protein
MSKGNVMKQRSLWVLLAFAALFLATTASTSLASPPDTGIQGTSQLYISYGVPTEVEPGVFVSPGDLMFPVSTSFTVLSAHSNREIGRFTTGSDGAFSLALPPGKYVLVPDTLTFGITPFSQSFRTDSFEVTVSARKFTYALILYYYRVGSAVASGN